MNSAGERFCLSCGGPLEVRHDAEGHQRPTCPRCGFILYRNPKPSGNALVVQEGRLLLVQRAVEPYFGWWDIPGGFLEGREHPEEGARREVKEETGLEVEITGLVGIFMGSYPYGSVEDSTLNLYYEARPTGGVLHAGSDAQAVAWFPPGRLPGEIAFRCAREALEAWKRGRGL